MHLGYDISKGRLFFRNALGYLRRLQRLETFQNNGISFCPHG
jgi:hypothetical protein